MSTEEKLGPVLIAGGGIGALKTTSIETITWRDANYEEEVVP